MSYTGLARSSTSINWLGLTFGIYKWGRLIQITVVSGGLTSQLKAYEAYTLGTLPSGYRPTKEMSKNILLAENVQARLVLTIAGVLQLTLYSAMQEGYTPLINEILF